MFDRRQFVRTVSTASLVTAGLDVPGFLERTARAAPTSERPGAKDTILVVVQLTGGNDGLNTVVPMKDPLYEKYRQALRLPQNQLKKLDESHGLHPSMAGFAGLLEDRLLCVVQGVGYPNPSQSHFRSMDIWQAGSLASELTEGWLGKTLGKLKQGQGFHLAMENEASWLALSGAPVKVPSLTKLSDFQLKPASISSGDRGEQQRVLERAAQSTAPAGLLDFVRRTSVATYDSSRRLQEIGQSYQPKATYPNSGLANRLKLAAQLIQADLGARIYYVTIDGFDTHAGQLNPHANLLREVSDALTAFYRDMKAHGHHDRVLVMTFSEFGRRVPENGSKGTDHGSAAPMFLIGSKVKAGLVGAHPRLDQLEAGNLKHHTDFRQVYATILNQWLGVKSAEILGAEFKEIEIFA